MAAHALVRKVIELVEAEKVITARRVVVASMGLAAVFATELAYEHLFAIPELEAKVKNLEAQNATTHRGVCLAAWPQARSLETARDPEYTPQVKKWDTVNADAVQTQQDETTCHALGGIPGVIDASKQIYFSVQHADGAVRLIPGG
jgi:hypothetical protein